MVKASLIYKSRIFFLRKAMKNHGISIYIVPSADPHLSEYLPAYWKVKEWLTGFTGSSGVLVVTLDSAILFVDSRYWQQAEYELDGTDVALVKIFSNGTCDHIDWVIEHFCEFSQENLVVGISGHVISFANFLDYRSRLAKVGIKLCIEFDLIKEIWLDRPNFPSGLITEHSISFAIIDRQAKIHKIANKIKKSGAEYCLITSLDDIAWILNLRGSDTDYTPVFFAYLVISAAAEVHLFVNLNKIPNLLFSLLQSQGICFHEYEAIDNFLRELSLKAHLLFDSKRTNVSIVKNLVSFRRISAYFEQAPFVPYSIQSSSLLGFSIVDSPNPVSFLKASKSFEEIACIRETMLKDGVALVEFFSALDSALIAQEVVSEVTIAEHLEKFRSYQSDYISPSFNTIAAFKENAALPHYKASKKKCSFIEGNGLLLIDSGGQYLGGTTDITRMVAIGNLSDEEKRDCTIVLKGLIALTCAKFPIGIKAPMLDSIARLPLWSCCVDYGHGTGHGVGYFLNVHEGTHSISYRSDCRDQIGLQKGMINSIEPGVYRPGKWGVRIENLVVVQPCGNSEFGDFLEFETLTLAPIDRRCLLIDMLSIEEIAWINNYHEKVATALRPALGTSAQLWLDRMTAPI